ncbi:UDP-N-acetylmuramoyl-L-alanine--D-glutamate ligase [Candidatus Regiella insecticola]|uniref:UDP-N-acetylmuramoylalanine--D-glutamate ligase n=1 Tax=Candidatus Regiella insecticola TaxID=138073 RepID=A0A6L2ZS45_9ENTR|nr:UDP-N-acetylmuramoyl-L-alanine--D-glutamate ligase [Candidatus Regiella insecticola]GFN47349.1 UDP-N-acetylmuramoylalanine--D-glutamate ligase [Candidatus Regiella insecticola]
MIDYRGKKVVIIGLGLTGISCVEFFMAKGVTPRVMDTRINPPNVDQLPAVLECHFGSLNQKWLLGADLIVASPGVALADPLLNQAVEAGVEVIGDIELFCRENQVPIVAITGSNGKSTVTTLLGEMARNAGWQVGVGGNIGIPALTLLKQKYQLIVLELSSFQLETTYSLQAQVATILNISEDHSDRYPQGLEQYQAAKLRIYENAHTCVVNVDDALTKPKQDTNAHYSSFGVDVGDYHLHKQQNTVWLQAHGEKVLETDKMKLSGRHNHINALAALALADAAGIPRSSSLAVLTTYTGLAHRFQSVFKNKGISWINDSKATNVVSTKAALEGLAIEGTLYLLLGGDGKSADFSPLLPFLQGEHIRIYCFGRDGQKLAQLRPEISQCTDTLQQAMRLLAPQLVTGDLVLLSPACASLDQFRNYEQRGNEFAYLAKELG